MVASLEFHQLKVRCRPSLIAILDYGSGNLRSAERAFATSGHDVVVTADRKIALEATGLVIPGVGAFAACMSGLKSVAGDEIARERVALGRPTLGICIGMQILFESGLEHAENGAHQGVGIWSGMVKKLNSPILPTMEPSTPISTSSAIAAISAKDETPPLATTGALVAAQTDFNNSRFGPVNVPSFATSVTM